VGVIAKPVALTGVPAFLLSDSGITPIDFSELSNSIKFADSTACACRSGAFDPAQVPSMLLNNSPLNVNAGDIYKTMSPRQ